MRNVRVAAGVYLALIILAGGVALAHNRASAAPAMRVAEAGAPLCRYGVNSVQGGQAFTGLDTAALRIGWYLNYTANKTADQPAGLGFLPVIRLAQTGPNSYTYSPNSTQLANAIAANPGAMWLIGNEPDRRIFQDSMEPHVYAAAYHELYHLIKGADPSAQIVAGTIVQPTPLRLQYLDMVLFSYWQQFGNAMPVDGWSIHNFILNEVSCSYDPDCWGAGIPPGIDAPFGERITVDDNDNIELFKERLIRFRVWMKERGYADKPLHLTEYGVLMPPEYGFDAPRVNAFMNASFDFMTAASDPALGFPADDYRLVQSWSWYSLDHDEHFNGWLFDTSTRQLTAVGQNFANYTANIAITNDLYPWRLGTNPAAPFSAGGPVTIQLQATIANSGNASLPAGPVVVRFYRGDPSQGGVQIGSDQVVNLVGCGASAIVSVTWTGAPAGMHRIFVVVDAAGALAESNEANNTREFPLLVGTQRSFIPRVAR